MNVAALNENKQVITWPFWFKKIIRFEFWPFWVLYLPVLVYYLWLSIKARSLSFFTAANPGIYLGGFAGESKMGILSAIDKKYLPHTLFVKAGTNSNDLYEQLLKSKLDFPLVFKPDIGERGDGVEKITDKLAVEDYLNRYQHDTIIQSFVDWPLEAGVLYYRMPDGSSTGITSVVIKSFLSVTGDGKSTLEQLIHRTERAQLRLNYLLDKFNNRLNEVLDNGELLMLEPIGNHCRGTTFLSGQQFINQQMVEQFDKIASSINGFYIGRFDVKITSIEDLYSGNHIKILELNGVTSEPGHIYDPNCTLREAYRALFGHYALLYKIGQQNNRLGFDNAPFGLIWKEIKKKF